MLSFDIIKELKHKNQWGQLTYWELAGNILILPFVFSLDILLLPLELITYIIWKII